MIKIKRVYEKPEKEDGKRVLIDRLWPRGLKKEEARIDLWLREVAPSDSLRKWFSHEPSRWQEFRKRYFEELDKKKGLVNQILELEKSNGTVTLLFSSREERFNNANALLEYINSIRK